MLLVVCFSAFGQDEFPLHGHKEDFILNVLDKNMKPKRTGYFTPSVVEPRKKEIKRDDPGSCAHLTMLVDDNMLIRGGNRTLDSLINIPGKIVFLYQNTDWMDTSKYLTLLADSVNASHFIGNINKVKKREWELYRIVLHPKETNLYYTFYLRYQNSLISAKLPKRGSHDNFAIKSISPAIPVFHLGSVNDATRTFGPGLSFNIGLVPTRPLRRLAADILGPVSIEWMFQPVTNFHEALDLRSTALGLFFNSFYGIFHWGIAWYTPTYCRAEAYIGINIAPAMILFEGGRKQRYRW